MKIVRSEGCGARVQVNLDSVRGEDNGPEQAILLDARVEIVNLRAPQLGVVDGNSDKREGAVPHVAVSSLVHALQEGHMIEVRVQIVLDEARPPVCLRRRRVYKGDAGRALEVPHGGRVGVGSGTGLDPGLQRGKRRASWPLSHSWLSQLNACP